KEGCIARHVNANLAALQGTTFQLRRISFQRGLWGRNSSTFKALRTTKSKTYLSLVRHTIIIRGSRKVTAFSSVVYSHSKSCGATAACLEQAMSGLRRGDLRVIFRLYQARI